MKIIEGSVEKIAFTNSFFDLVTAFETYYFWPNLPDDFKEINRVLKIGGKLLLVNELKFAVTPAKVIEETHVKLYAADKKSKPLMQSAGFVDVQVFTESGSAVECSYVAQKPLHATARHL